MKRRDFISLIGGAAAWPLAAHAQQAASPVIGFLGSGSPDGFAGRVAAFNRGVTDTVGREVAVEYRWANGAVERLPTLASDLVQRRVDIIVTAGGPGPVLAARAATTNIPIVFDVGADPIKAGLVTSLNQPGGNVTGIYYFSAELNAKRMGLLHDLLPKAALIAVLQNPTTSSTAEQLREVQAAAQATQLQIRYLNATSSAEISDAFANLSRSPPDALVVFSDPVFNDSRDQIVTSANSQMIPTVYATRDFAAAGGLMSYGTNSAEEYRQAGTYAGRILKGEKPAQMPIMQSVKFQFVINAKTAKALRLTIPPQLLAAADEVIE